MSAALDGAVKTSELAWVRAKQLIDRITVIRYQLFTRNLLEKRDSPMLPGVWRDVGRTDSVVRALSVLRRRLADMGGSQVRPAVCARLALRSLSLPCAIC